MEQPKRKNNNGLFIFLMMAVIMLYVVASGGITKSSSSNTYVKPYHTRTGKMVKGHVRKSVSTSPNAVKSRNYSKGYYKRHKYRYRKAKKE
jgi:flagellar basal body-associated protein FliL